MEYEKPHTIIIVIDTLRNDYAKTIENKLDEWRFISYKNANASHVFPRLSIRIMRWDL